MKEIKRVPVFLKQSVLADTLLLNRPTMHNKLEIKGTNAKRLKEFLYNMQNDSSNTTKMKCWLGCWILD